MKTIIIILFVLFSGTKLQAQTFSTYADTANYLISQVENKKSQYIGKPFSVLYDSLKIKPVDAMTGYATKDQFGKSVYFDFNYQKGFSKEHFIIIDFQNIPDYVSLYNIFFPKDGERGSIQSILTTYKPLIVKEIILKDYQQDDPVDPNVMHQQE